MFITTNSDKIQPNSSGIYFDTINDKVEFYKNGSKVENYGVPGPKGDKGDKGDTGDSAIFDPENPDTPLFEMANAMGTSTTKSMTQKAITDVIIDYNVIDYNAMPEPLYIREMILNGTGSVVSGQSAMRIYYMHVNAGEIIKISCQGNAANNAGVGIGLSNKEIPEIGDNAELFFPGITDTDFEKIIVIPNNGYLWVGIKISSSFNITFYNSVNMKDYLNINLNNSINNIEELAINAKEKTDTLNIDVQKIIEAVGSEIDTVNLLDPAQAIVGHSCNGEGIIVENEVWDVCPINVDPGKKYYFYYDGELSDLGASARRAVDANGRIVATATSSTKSISIPEISEEVTTPIILYVNYRNNKSSEALDVNQIMVSTIGSLSEHHYYNNKIIGTNIPQVELINNIKEIALNAKEKTDVVNVDIQKIITAVGSETDTVNLLNPTQAIPNHSCNSEGAIVENAPWDVCPINVELGMKYYFYYDGELSDLGNSARRAVDANGQIVATALNTAKSITIPEQSENILAPITLYVNYRNNQNSANGLDVNKIMVSTIGSLSEHHYYNDKIIGTNIPQVDLLDHTPILNNDPLAKIISNPSRARIFPIYGVIGGSFETGYTNAYSDETSTATQFYDNSENSEVPVANGWGYEWPTLLTQLNYAILGNYAMAGHSFYWWLREYILNNNGKLAAKNFRNDGLMPQALILNMSGNEVGERGNTGTGGYSASLAKYPTELTMGTASNDIWNTDYTDVTMDSSAPHYLNGLTYCEMIAAIVQLVRKKSPDCKIFFSTLRKDTSRHDAASEYEIEMVNTFKNMQSITPNSYLIDLNQYGIDWGNEIIKTRYIRGSHPTRLGHIYLCDEFNTYIDWIIGNNMESFRDAAYINTPYHL